jgi:hypothetical protein
MTNTTLFAKNGNFPVSIVNKNNYKNYGEKTKIVLLMDESNTGKSVKWVNFNTSDNKKINLAFTNEKFIKIFADYQINNFNRLPFKKSATLITFYTLEEFFQKNPNKMLTLDIQKEIDLNKPILEI